MNDNPTPWPPPDAEGPPPIDAHGDDEYAAFLDDDPPTARSGVARPAARTAAGVAAVVALSVAFGAGAYAVTSHLAGDDADRGSVDVGGRNVPTDDGAVPADGNGSFPGPQRGSRHDGGTGAPIPGQSSNSGVTSSHGS